jgi:prophage antirepressor-like protein
MNNSTLHTFYFESQKIRIVMKDGNPWFVLDDICKVLEIPSNEFNDDKITKLNLNNLKGNLIDFNSFKTNGGERNGK